MELSKMIRSKVQEAVDKAPKLGLSRVDWDVSFGFGPAPNGQLIGAYWVPLTTPSMLLGQHVGTLACITDVHGDQKVIDKVVADAIDNLRTMKAQAASNLNGHNEGGGGQIG
jgi:hypothetical protein